MPKSKRARLVHLNRVTKKTRADKDSLFQKIRDCVGQYAYCYVLSVENTRNNHMQDVRRELRDSRLFFGKTKLMARALGSSPATAAAPGTHNLHPWVRGSIGLLFSDRAPAMITSFFSSLTALDFARAGAIARADFVLPPGLLRASGGFLQGIVNEEDDPVLPAVLEPELRRLNVPVRLIKGKVVLGGDEEGEGSTGYVVCRAGDTLDARQTRLLKMFGVCMAEFKVNVMAYWAAASEEVTGLIDPSEERLRDEAAESVVDVEED